MRKYLTRLCKAIIAGKFNDENYRDRKSWYGKDVQTCPLFCSYGTIGFTADVYNERGRNYCTVSFDGDLDELTIDDIPWKEFINLLYLEDYDISSGDDQYYRELLIYTDAGENMIVPLEKVDKKHLQSYIDGFDINHEVSLWWPNGFKSEDKWFPHDNMKEHYEDYEAYLKKLQRICNHMPY